MTNNPAILLEKAIGAQNDYMLTIFWSTVSIQGLLNALYKFKKIEKCQGLSRIPVIHFKFKEVKNENILRLQSLLLVQLDNNHQCNYMKYFYKEEICNDNK